MNPPRRWRAAEQLTTVVNSEGEYKADVLVDCGHIVAVGLDLPRDDATVVHTSGAHVIPGSIDVHTYFQMHFGGTASCDTLVTGMKAATTGEPRCSPTTGCTWPALISTRTH